MKRRFRVTVDGETFVVEVEEIETAPVKKASSTERSTAAAPRRIERRGQTDGESVVTAPLPGVVSEVRIGVGDRVEAGAVLLVLEAMKMENEVYAPVGGVVSEIYVEAGQQVGRGDRLVLIS
ncbi:acetyl-CoA carboxylase biotin carboxyl carrier protein subunit [Candidatus Bathyarchaeota archaeon]|nr:MAG: acetyl-CoA carboxylase biotin carboxyl carrier protein subunit [Candidatus Bathyarchaeota archaeon]